MFRQLADFFRHHGESSSLLTSAGGFDRRVQCEQIGLAGDAGNEADDNFDLPRTGFEIASGALCPLRFFADVLHLRDRPVDRVLTCHRRLSGSAGLAGHFLGGGRQLFHGRRNFLHNRRGIIDRFDLFFRAMRHIGHGCRHLVGRLG